MAKLGSGILNYMLRALCSSLWFHYVKQKSKYYGSLSPLKTNISWWSLGIIFRQWQNGGESFFPHLMRENIWSESVFPACGKRRNGFFPHFIKSWAQSVFSRIRISQTMTFKKNLSVYLKGDNNELQFQKLSIEVVSETIPNLTFRKTVFASTLGTS